VSPIPQKTDDRACARTQPLKSVLKALATASHSHDGSIPITTVAMALTARAAAIPPEMGSLIAYSCSGSLKNM